MLTPAQEAELIAAEAVFRREVAQGLLAAAHRLTTQTDELRRATAEMDARNETEEEK